MADWADERAAQLLPWHYACEDSWYSCPQSIDGCADDNAGEECRCELNESRSAIAAALREAREPLEKEIAALHDLLAQAWALIDPQEHLCEVICNTLDCGTDGKPTPCTHYQQALDRAYEEGRDDGACEERRAVWQVCMDRATHKPTGSQTEFVEYEVARDIALAIAARGPMQEGGGE